MRADRCYDYIDHPINEVTTKLSKLRLYSYQTALILLSASDLSGRSFPIFPSSSSVQEYKARVIQAPADVDVKLLPEGLSDVWLQILLISQVCDCEAPDVFSAAMESP